MKMISVILILGMLFLIGCKPKVIEEQAIQSETKDLTKFVPIQNEKMPLGMDYNRYDYNDKTKEIISSNGIKFEMEDTSILINDKITLDFMVKSNTLNFDLSDKSNEISSEYKDGFNLNFSKTINNLNIEQDLIISNSVYQSPKIKHRLTNNLKTTFKDYSFYYIFSGIDEDNIEIKDDKVFIEDGLIFDYSDLIENGFIFKENYTLDDNLYVGFTGKEFTKEVEIDPTFEISSVYNMKIIPMDIDKFILLYQIGSTLNYSYWDTNGTQIGIDYMLTNAYEGGSSIQHLLGGG